MDPLEVVIAAIKETAPTLAGGQIASRSHFATDGVGKWPVGSSGIVIRLDGGQPELYLSVHDVRLEVRCFAADEASAIALANGFSAAAKLCERLDVAVTGNTALLYFLLPESSMSLMYDNDLAKDFTLLFYRARIHEQGVE